MYSIIKQNISNGNFRLTDIQHKIKKLYIMGDITEDNFDELMTLAAYSASADAERPETLAMIRNLSERVEVLEGRLKALESGSDEEPDVSDEGAVYPVWEPWDGISNNYQRGAIVDHNDELWQSTYQGQNVWEPGAPGIDERFWVRYNPDAVIEFDETV